MLFGSAVSRCCCRHRAGQHLQVFVERRLILLLELLELRQLAPAQVSHCKVPLVKHTVALQAHTPSYTPQLGPLKTPHDRTDTTCTDWVDMKQAVLCLVVFIVSNDVGVTLKLVAS